MRLGLKDVLLVPALCWFSLAFAQIPSGDPPPLIEAETPLLLQMMALVPAIPETLELRLPFSYADYRALEATMPGLRPFSDYAEFVQADDARRNVWFAAMRRLVGGSGSYAYSELISNPTTEAMPQVVGFDLFEINQGVYWGQPPSNGTFFVGDFSREAIRAAFANREYTQEDFGDVEVWCPPKGCDSGRDVDLTGRNPANPFGGNMGRQEPIILGDGWIFSAAGIEHQAAVLAGDTPSLLAIPQFSAIARALLSHGNVLQLQFVYPLELNGETHRPRFPEVREAMMAEVQSVLQVPLPPYSLVAIADLIEVDGDENLAVIALAYHSEVDAQAAGPVLIERLQDATHLFSLQPVMTLLEQRDMSIDAPQVFVDETEWFVTLLSFRYPRPSTEPESTLVDGLGYDLLMTMLYQKDLLWLAHEFTEFQLPD